jgi:hypothetical protein
LHRPEPDASRRRSLEVAREEQFTGRWRILARQGRLFRPEILEGEIEPERGCVCVEQLCRGFEIDGRSDTSDLEEDFRHGIAIRHANIARRGLYGPRFCAG